MTASTTLLADAKAMVAITPNAASQVKANAAAGPIMDIQGMCSLYLAKIQEAKLILNNLSAVVDSSDATLKGYVTNDLLTLV
jgi:hypothetical protein